jgi:hypothetical protein
MNTCVPLYRYCNEEIKNLENSFFICHTFILYVFVLFVYMHLQGINYIKHAYLLDNFKTDIELEL